MRNLITFLAVGLLSSVALASPSKVANCWATARDTYGATGKQAAALCKKFKGAAVYTCFQQAKQMGLDGDLAATLCNETDTLIAIQCYQLVVQAGATPAEASTACSGDKP